MKLIKSEPKVLSFEEWMDAQQDRIDDRIEICELCSFDDDGLCPECFDEFRREYKAARERETAAWEEWHKPFSSLARNRSRNDNEQGGG